MRASVASVTGGGVASRCRGGYMRGGGGRSEEGRVGEEGRFRGGPGHLKKKKKKPGKDVFVKEWKRFRVCYALEWRCLRRVRNAYSIVERMSFYLAYRNVDVCFTKHCQCV